MNLSYYKNITKISTFKYIPYISEIYYNYKMNLFGYKFYIFLY